MSKIVISMILSIFLVGCAFDLAHVSYTPTTYIPKSGKTFKIKEDADITGSPCGYSRILSKNSTWNLIASIPEGEVYRSKDQVLTVECSNIHEAYPVISNGSMVGFYLPVEKGFVKLRQSIILNREQGE